MDEEVRQLEFIAMKAAFKLKMKGLQHSASDPNKKANNNANRKGRKNEGKFAWKSTAPQPGEPTEKMVDGKIYIYCPHYGDTKWALKVNCKGIEHVTSCRVTAKAMATPNTQALTISLLTTITDDQKHYARALASVFAEDANNKCAGEDDKPKEI